MDDQETDFLEDTETEIKPKKQLSEQKLQHLANIRVKALEKKKEMKQMTEKANEHKKIESLKEAKRIQKEQLAKKYDELIVKTPFTTVLTKAQNEIAFCLLLGFSIRKEILTILSKYLQVDYPEHKIKNELTMLYAKFNCNSAASLLNTLLLNNIDITIPDGFLMPGTFIVRG